MGFITEVHLDQWADTIVARHKLGELIRRLILAGTSLSSIGSPPRFLSGESNHLSGWDGFLECSSTVPWIPDGISVWELGVGKDARARAK